MIVSDARIEANRKNAMKSRGPVTEAGKARSRANALTHGLTARVLTAHDDANQVEARSREWAGAFPAAEGYSAWVLEQVAVVTLKIERAERVEAELRGKMAIRAGICWDDDRRIEVEVIASKLAKTPGETVERLKAIAHGVDWLIHRWLLLLRAAEIRMTWTPEQKSLAFDLLGTPVEFRDRVEPGLPVGGEGYERTIPPQPIALARREVEALKARRDELEELDELDQAMARADLLDDASPEIRRLRRYQGTLQRQLRWCLAQLQGQGKPATNPPDWVAPAPVEEVAIEAEATPEDGEPQPEVAEQVASGTPARRRDPEELRRQARRAARRQERGRLRS